MSERPLKDTLIGEESMALRQIASGAKAAAIPQSVRMRLEILSFIARNDYGQLTLTERGRQSAVGLIGRIAPANIELIGSVTAATVLEFLP